MKKVLMMCFLVLLTAACMADDETTDDLEEIDFIEWEEESVELTMLIFHHGSGPTRFIDEYVEAYT